MKKRFLTMSVILLIAVFSSTSFALDWNPLNLIKGKSEEKKQEQKDVKEQKDAPKKEEQTQPAKTVESQPAPKLADEMRSMQPVQQNAPKETEVPKPQTPVQAQPAQTQQPVTQQPQLQSPQVQAQPQPAVVQPQQPVQKADIVPAVMPPQAAEPETSRKFINNLEANSPQAAAVLKDVVDVMYCGKIVEEIALDELKRSVVEGPFYGYLMARSIGDKAVYKDIVAIFRKLNCESTYKNSLEMYLLNQKNGRMK